MPTTFHFKIIKLLIILTLSVSISVSVPAMALKMACNHFPPLKIEKPEPGFPGSDIEVLRESFKLNSIEVTTTFYPWKRAFSMAQSGEMDGLCSCSYVKDRDKYFFYSDEIGKSSIGIFSKKKMKIKSLNDLKDKKIGVIRGYNLEKELKDKQIQIIPASSDKILFKMLNAGRIDAAYSYQVTVLELQRKNKFIEKLEYLELKSSPYYTCISKKLKSGKDVVDKFNEGLLKIKASGIYQNILNKYQLQPI